MSRLCDKCSRSMFNKTCGIPAEYNKDMFLWKKQREVLNEDGTCDFYTKERMIDKIKDYLSTPYYRVLRMFGDIRDFFKYSVFKRIKYKFDIRDTWDLNTSISEFIIPRLTYFINSKPMGTPGLLLDRKFVEDNDLSKYFSGELKDEWFDRDSDTYEPYNAWMNILSAMLTSFEYNSDKFDDKYSYMDINGYGEHEINNDRYQEIMDMNTEGLRLFALFFGNLWD